MKHESRAFSKELSSNTDHASNHCEITTERHQHIAVKTVPTILPKQIQAVKFNYPNKQ